MEHEGYKVIAYGKDGNEAVLVDIEPDGGGRDVAEHGICKSLYYLSEIEQIRQRHGQGETLGMVSELAKYAVTWLYSLAVHTAVQEGHGEAASSCGKE